MGLQGEAFFRQKVQPVPRQEQSPDLIVFMATGIFSKGEEGGVSRPRNFSQGIFSGKRGEKIAARLAEHFPLPGVVKHARTAFFCTHLP